MALESNSVFDRFKDFFVESRVEAPEQEEDRSLADYKEEIRDARMFAGSQAFQKYRRMLVSDIEQAIPDPAGGTDAAAACAFTQAGLRKALNYLDTVANFATEDPDG